MVVVHVPLWPMEVAFEDHGDGEMGSVSHYFTRGHASTSFLWSLDDHLRYHDGRRFWDLDDIDLCVVRNEWWVQMFYEAMDGPDYWTFEPCDSFTPSAFPVTYVLASDIEEHLVDVCNECGQGDHDRCSNHCLRPVVVMTFTAGGTWIGEQSIDVMKWSTWRKK